MTKYRKKPVEVEARLFTRESVDELIAWVGGECYQRYLFGEPQTLVLVIPTLEGNMEATEGDFIIQGVAGEFYPCKPDIFEQTYEIVEG